MFKEITSRREFLRQAAFAGTALALPWLRAKEIFTNFLATSERLKNLQPGETVTVSRDECDTDPVTGQFLLEKGSKREEKEQVGLMVKEAVNSRKVMAIGRTVHEKEEALPTDYFPVNSITKSGLNEDSALGFEVMAGPKEKEVSEGLSAFDLTLVGLDPNWTEAERKQTYERLAATFPRRSHVLRLYFKLESR